MKSFMIGYDVAYQGLLHNDSQCSIITFITTPSVDGKVLQGVIMRIISASLSPRGENLFQNFMTSGISRG